MKIASEIETASLYTQKKKKFDVESIFPCRKKNILETS